jgi:DNA-binding response OmpR family regulator
MTGASPRCTLLVVDACRDSQARIHEHLQGRGYSIITAADPDAAGAMIDLMAPDVVITDLFLPQGSGLTLTAALRTRPEPCPVIVMSDQHSEHCVMQALRAGAVDFLHKPVGVEDLAHALQRARRQAPANLAETPGVRLFDYTLTTGSNPAHIPGIVSWLITATAATLPEVRRLHLRGTLSELLFNAMEHGNLEVFYQEKQQALAEQRYDELLADRLSQPRLAGRRVTIRVRYDKLQKILEYHIADEGKGFKWQTLLRRSHESCLPQDISGRGVFLAQSLFPNLSYNDRGNEVRFTVELD